MASFALFNFEFEPILNKLRQAELKGMESVLWNWQMGRDLVQKKAEERWGAGIVEQVSIDLRREFPNENGFSTSNLWYMKKWYLFYAGEEQKLQRLIGELQNSVNQEYEKIQCSVGEIPKQSVSEIGSVAFIQFPLPFALIPWGQHIEIITRSKSIDEAFFYIHQVIDKGLSRPALINCINAKLYETQGKIANNFSEHLPELWKAANFWVSKSIHPNRHKKRVATNLTTLPIGDTPIPINGTRPLFCVQR